MVRVLWRMYNQAPRPLTQPSGSTVPGVGPGTYNQKEEGQER